MKNNRNKTSKKADLTAFNDHNQEDDIRSSESIIPNEDDRLTDNDSEEGAKSSGRITNSSQTDSKEGRQPNHDPKLDKIDKWNAEELKELIEDVSKKGGSHQEKNASSNKVKNKPNEDEADEIKDDKYQDFGSILESTKDKSANNKNAKKNRK